MRLLRALSFIFFIGVIPNSANAQKSKVDEAATSQLIANLLCTNYVIPIGYISVRGELGSSWLHANDPQVPNTNHKMGPVWYKIINSFAQVGLVTVTADPQFQRYKSGQSFDWNTFLSQSQGLIDVIHVALTDSAKEYVSPDGLSAVIPTCSVKSFMIIKIDYHDIGIDNYAAIFFTFTADWRPSYREFAKINSGTELQNERKGIILEKFDSFSNQWKPDLTNGYDIANLNEPFPQNRVQIKY